MVLFGLVHVVWYSGHLLRNERGRDFPIKVGLFENRSKRKRIWRLSHGRLLMEIPPFSKETFQTKYTIVAAAAVSISFGKL